MNYYFKVIKKVNLRYISNWDLIYLVDKKKIFNSFSENMKAKKDYQLKIEGIITNSSFFW